MLAYQGYYTFNFRDEKDNSMKKVMILSAAILAISVFPAMAESDVEGGKHAKGAMFEKHDTNGDGTISKDEFLSHAEERFSNIDTDGDGSVSKEEAKAGHEKKRAEMKERMKERKEKREERRENRAADSE